MQPISLDLDMIYDNLLQRFDCVNQMNNLSVEKNN